MVITPPPVLHSGKVRDTYDAGDGRHLVMVASDRISAFDVIMNQPVPGKGVVLTHMTDHWLRHTRVGPIMLHHLVTTDVAKMPDWAAQFKGRAMLVRRLRMLPVEAVVRGYLTGSAWKDYQNTRQVSGISLSPGLVQMERFPKPIFTPSTKATTGHDEAIDLEQMALTLGSWDIARQVRDRSLWLYNAAEEYAREHGIILVDTKFEFGLNEHGELVLADEVLTPDSSRYVRMADYEVGKPPKSMDKQYLRDWLEEKGWNKQPPPPRLPARVIDNTLARYVDAAVQLTGTNPLA